MVAIPYLMCMRHYAQGVNEGKGKPDKDAGMSEKVPSNVCLRKESGGEGGTGKRE